MFADSGVVNGVQVFWGPPYVSRILGSTWFGEAAVKKTDMMVVVKSSQVKSTVKSSQVVGLRTRVASIRTLIFSSPHPYAGLLWRGLSGVGH